MVCPASTRSPRTPIPAPWRLTTARCRRWRPAGWVCAIGQSIGHRGPNHVLHAPAPPYRKRRELRTESQITHCPCHGPGPHVGGGVGEQGAISPSLPHTTKGVRASRTPAGNARTACPVKLETHRSHQEQRAGKPHQRTRPAPPTPRDGPVAHSRSIGQAIHTNGKKTDSGPAVRTNANGNTDGVPDTTPGVLGLPVQVLGEAIQHLPTMTSD